MSQQFEVYVLSDSSKHQQVAQALERRGYAVGDARRNVGNSLNVRVREDTGDAKEVAEVVALLDPGAARLPSASPTMTLRNYRTDHD